MKMKIAYIAHPVSGDVKGNIEKIIEVVRQINLNEPDVVPFVPYLADLYALDDDAPEERERGIKNDTYLLKAGFVDEVRLYGHTVSKGMRAEIRLANEMKIPVTARSLGTFDDIMKTIFFYYLCSCGLNDYMVHMDHIPTPDEAYDIIMKMCLQSNIDPYFALAETGFFESSNPTESYKLSKAFRAEKAEETERRYKEQTEKYKRK